MHRYGATIATRSISICYTKHFSIVLLCMFYIISSLQAQVSVEGSITDATGAPVMGCVLRVKKNQNPALLHFEMLTQTNRFGFTLQDLRKGDTVEVEITHMSYQTLVHKIPVTQLPKKESLQFILTPQAKELKEIVIKPAIWRRGDTTIFSIDSFTNGEERKLKDIITKLPGFTSDPNGQLRFKNKKVEKIFIEGQDLFADRTNLLLESFPVHVLSEIEAIENDPKNKLLKGLSIDNQTVINLRLKNKAHTVFGDMNATGTGNRRYALNPTLFSVNPKLKLATIGFFNNLGGDLKQLFPELQPAAPIARLQLQFNNIFTINNFEASRYLNNRLYNQQAVIQYKPGKKFDAATEISYAQEQINQSYRTDLVLLNTAGTLNRSETVANTFKTQRGRLEQKMDWTLSSQKAMRLQLTAEVVDNRFTDGSFIQQPDFTDNISSRASERKWLATVAWQYTHRIDSAQAFVARYNAQWWQNRQQGASNNNSLPLIFPASPPDADQLQLQSLPRLQHHDARLEWLRRKAGTIYTQQLQLQSSSIQLQNILAIGKQNDPMYNGVLLSDWSGQGQLQVHKAGYQTSYQQQKQIYHFNLQIYAGTSWLKRTHYSGQPERRLLPEFSTALQYNRFLRKRQMIPVQIEAKYQALTPEQMPTFPIPVQYNTFAQMLYGLQAIPGAKISTGYAWFPLTGKSTNIQVFYERLFANEIWANRFELFFRFEQRQLIQRGAGRYGYSFNQNFIIPAIKARAHFYSNAFINQYFLDAGNATPVKASNLFSAAGATLNFDNFKKLSFYVSAQATYLRNFLPTSSPLSNLRRPVLNYQQTANSRWRINPQTSLGVQTTWYQFDLTTAPQRMFFADADFRWQPANSRWSADLKLENIFNRQRYLLTRVGPNSIALTEMPLIGRNLQVSVRMNF